MKRKLFDKIVQVIILGLLFCLLLAGSAFSQTNYTVSGRVTDALTGQAVQASILIYSMEKNAVDKVAVLEDGTYSVSLRAGSSYRLAAYSLDGSYEIEFYNNVSNLVDATPIVLDKDYTNIDFTLTKKHVYENGLHGIVKNEVGEPISANVYARPYSSQYSDQYFAAADKMNPGVFTFTNMRPGQYILYAVPEGDNLINGYYKENEKAVSSPDNATVITVNENGINAADYIITLSAKQVQTTVYEIKGIITDEQNQPLEGVNISIKNSAGQEIITKDSKVTDPIGSFVIFFEANGPDKYLLTANKEGYKEAYYSCYLDDKNPGQAAFITMIDDNLVVYQNGIKGFVQNQSGEGVISQIIAVMLSDVVSSKPNKNTKTVVTSKENPGTFLLENLNPGDYLLYVTPVVQGYKAGYYHADGEAVDNIPDATVITVNETGINQDNYIVTLPEKDANPQITYELYGYVFNDNNSPLSGVVITATDAKEGNNVPDNDNVTDQNGMFHIVFTNAGTYNIRAVKDGYIDASGTLTFDYDMPVQKTIITMYVKTEQNKGQPDSKIMSGIKDNQTDYSITVFPNPVSSEININTGSAEGQIDVRIYSINGFELITKSFNSTSGMDNLTLNVDSLQTGCYIARIYVNGKSAGAKMFVKD